MGKINNQALYPPQDPIQLTDLLIGSDGVSGITKNFNVGNLLQYFVDNADTPITGLISVESIDVEDGVVTVTNVVYAVNSVQFTIGSQDIPVPSATDGFYRTDLIVGNTAGVLSLVQGVESAVNPVAPIQPLNTALISRLNVFGDDIQVVIPIEVPTAQQVFEAGRTVYLDGGSPISLQHISTLGYLSSLNLSGNGTTQLGGNNVQLFGITGIDFSHQDSITVPTINVNKNITTTVNGVDADTTGNITLDALALDFPYVDPRDFGAVGDGVTNDRQAFQDAIDYAEDNDIGMMIVPEGRFNCTGGLIINDTLKIVGCAGNYTYTTQGVYNTGDGAVIFTTSATEDFITVNAIGLSLRDISFVNFAVTTPTAGTGLKIMNAGNFDLNNVNIHRFYTNCEIHEGVNWKCDHVVFSEGVSRNVYIMNPIMNDQGDWSFTSCAFMSNNDTMTHAYIENSGGMKFVNCKFQPTLGNPTRFSIGVHLNIIPPGTSQLMIVNCSIEGFRDYGVRVTMQPGAGFGNVIINGCQIAPVYTPMAGNLVYMDGVVNVSIANCALSGGLGQSNPAIRLLNCIYGNIYPNTYSNWTTEFDITGSTGINTNRYALLGSGTLTNGSIPFVTAPLQLSQDNANFFWDNTNKRQGIGTATPTAKLHINGLDTSDGIVNITSTATGGRGTLQKLGLLGYQSQDNNGSNIFAWGMRFDGASNQFVRMYTAANNYLPYVRLNTNSMVNIGGTASNSSANTNPTIVNWFTFDVSNGQLTLGGAPPVGTAGTYDLLLRNTSTGLVNRVNVLPFNHGGTGLSTVTALSYLRVNAGGTAYEQRTPSQVLSDIGAASTAYADAKVADAINDGTTTIAPSQNAVFDALALKANLASPTFTGDPKSVTPATSDNDTSIATTAFVNSFLASKIKYGATLVTFDGVATVFNIPHGLGAIPTSFSISFGDASNLNFVQSQRTLSSTNITLTCADAPVAGSQTVYWQVFA